MTDTSIMSATDASRGFSELLHRVCYGGESFVIKKGNRLMARITPVSVEGEAEAKTETAEAPAKASDEKIPENMTPEEAEFYVAWMEQVRKVEA